MKSSRTKAAYLASLILTLTLSLAAMAGPASASASTLSKIHHRGYAIVAVANEIPFGFMDSSGKAKGIGPDVARKVLHAMGIKHIQWVVTTFGSLIPGLKARRFDIVAAGMAIHPQRCDQVLFSEPNSSYGDGLLVKAGNPHKIHSFSDIKSNPNLKIGVVGGSDAYQVAQSVGIPADRIVIVSSNSDAVTAVQNGRMDAYAATGITVSRLAKLSSAVQAAQPFHDPVVKGHVVRDWGAFAFNRHSKQLRKAFNKHLATVQKTDWYRKTLVGYGLSQQDIQLASEKTTAELCHAKK